ncbi:hypothetical protein D3C76_1143080 [compost metagenome]
MQIDISGLISDAAAKILAPENLAPKVEKALDEALKNAIESAMGYNSDFRSMLKDTVSKAMPGGVDGVERIGKMVTDRVAALLQDAQQSAIGQVVDQELSELLQSIPEVMSMTELMTELTKRWAPSRLNHDSPEGERPTFIIETTDYGVTRLYADKDEGKEKSECRIEIAFSGDKETILSLYIDEKSYGRNNQICISRRYNADLFLLQLYVHGTKITQNAPSGEQDDYWYSNED